MRVMILCLLLIIAGILGCTRASATSTPPFTSTTTPTATSIPTTTAISPTATPEPFLLIVTEPEEDSVVSSSPVTVSGSTTPDAIVSVNGESVEVDIDGNFIAEVALEEGPNAIEVVASNLQGDQESVVLAVVYIP